jgi:hypothetical protein
MYIDLVVFVFIKYTTTKIIVNTPNWIYSEYCIGDLLTLTVKDLLMKFFNGYLRMLLRVAFYSEKTTNMSVNVYY